MALHRALFGHREKATLVRTADLFARVAMAATGATLVAVVVLIFGVVIHGAAGIVAGLAVLVFYVLAWAVVPLSLLRKQGGRPRV